MQNQILYDCLGTEAHQIINLRGYIGVLYVLVY